jgi:hypothetical protein
VKLSGLQFQATFKALDTLFEFVDGMAICNGFGEIIGTVSRQTGNRSFEMRKATEHFGIAFARKTLLRLNFLQVLKYKIIDSV